MAAPYPKTGYTCPACGTLWPTTMGALDCCGNWVYEVQGYACRCGLIFAAYADAEACCQPEPNTYFVKMVGEN